MISPSDGGEVFRRAGTHCSRRILGEGAFRGGGMERQRTSAVRSVGPSWSGLLLSTSCLTLGASFSFSVLCFFVCKTGMTVVLALQACDG